MNIKKTLITGMVAVACTGLLTVPTAFAKGNGYGGGRMAASGSSHQALSQAEADTLRFMREEEKLARDVYLTLYSTWGLPVFNNIAASEQKHTDSVQQLIQKYGLSDPVTNDSIGVFANSQLQALYTDLVRKGSESMLAALEVGAFIEEVDIDDLQRAIGATIHADIANVYSNLLKGSRNHLRAFAGQLAAQGATYTTSVLPQAEFDAIANSASERGNINGGGGRGRR